MTKTILGFLALMASVALGGADGGNPKKALFFHMTLDYRLTLQPGLSATPTGQDLAVRVDGALTYRHIGHFIIAPSDPVLNSDKLALSQPSEMICKRRSITGSKATIYWIGRDCSHAYFKLRYVELAESVRALKFP
jgi:hypothetical protein